ncbi:heterokaryon incompatibility protein-domain-containing protein [Gymnopilus junonius]|uniref:Heterokaryon incompatibility protein-domain-containing protein n=1 Tax=Gymnopilus junonius TaxID=109634 RepID=A0A9P5NRD5_GYMJU|nr:heterokaryon incompatibility protein-domain-containing protein [Gymnopilus junonius]
MTNHPSCPTLQHTRLPTHVVDCSDPQNPKLFSSLDVLETPDAALSYVWGQAQPHSTCSSNIDSYLTKVINFDVLPKTIQDAIICTHSLGLRYLWTDSLCIIQDSAEDTSHEISQMADIYNGAHVTIVAACAKKAGDGFLHDRKNLVNERVDSRVWCFQERLLSPRLLVYASHTLQYQCQAGMKNVGNASNFSVGTSIHDLQLPESTLGRSQERSQELWKLWKTILSNYSERCRPVLFSLLETDYIAGLWKHTLSQDLLWYRTSPSMPRLTQYRAPSWSWAATNGPIKDGGWPPKVEFLWNILHCGVTPSIPGYKVHTKFPAPPPSASKHP